MFDDGSEDYFREVLAPWIRDGLVTPVALDGRTQERVYTECLKQVRRFVKWIAFIDIDEFLFSPTGKLLSEVIDQFPNSSAVCVFWKLFGSSGRQGPSPRGVIEGLANPPSSSHRCCSGQKALAAVEGHPKRRSSHRLTRSR